MAKSERHKVSDNGLFKDWLKGQLRFGKCDDNLILFVPSHDRDKNRLKDQDVWASKALDLFGRLYGGATGFKQIVGTWRDDERDGTLIDDEPIIIQSLAKREDVEDEKKLEQLATFCRQMGKDTRQGAVGIIFNDAIHYLTNFA